jgi:lycopene cyclase domain-containing protein
MERAVIGLGYTLPAVISVIVVCWLELKVLRTGLFGKLGYWLTMAIVLGFQILIDGWLTKLSAPIVLYNQKHTSGVRFPWDIRVEDFLFGVALVTAVLLLWVKQGQRRQERQS